MNSVNLRGLYLRNIGANLFGVGTVALLNLVTPLDALKSVKTYFFSEGGWVILVIFYPSVVLAIVFGQRLIHSPILGLLERPSVPGAISAELQEKSRQRLLNLPFLTAALDLVAWIVLPTVIAGLFVLLKKVPLSTASFVYFRTVVVGIIASTLCFFLVEEFCRKRLIPMAFPEGKLALVPRTMKFPILRKIRVLYTAGTLVPMVILAGTLFFTMWDADLETISAMDLGRHVFLFTIVLCVVFVGVALRLNLLVGKSITEPLNRMLDVVKEAGSGNFANRIVVVSNDEIGILGDAGNAMLDGLLERDRIRETFGRYVTPEIRDQILEGRIPLDGERTVATIVFVDLRGFTRYVEETPPEEVIRSMRAYFTAMHRAIRNHGGLVLQFVGDEIEASFGMPLRLEGHAQKAVSAALEMRKALEALNQERVKMGREPFGHGIGIHTGEVLAGNTGSQEQPSYALIGDAVNLAKRIQELTKEFHCDILVSEDTVKELNGLFETERQAPLTVRGFSKPITVYRIVQ